MKIEIFKPADFEKSRDVFFKDDLFDDIADIANAKLNEWLKENGRVVYGFSDEDGVSMTTANDVYDTHTALLINIEPIKKEPCLHEPKVTYPLSGRKPNLNHDHLDFDRPEFSCKHCNAKLKATWEPA